MSAAADPPILIRGLDKRFKNVHAVRGIDLYVDPGEVVGFLGPNGAGKSTTIRCLLGFIRPSGGSTRILGRPAGDVQVRRRVGYLPSDLMIEPGITAHALLAWYADLRGGVDPKRVDALAERLRLDLDVRVGSLSKGNRQKVGIVQTFMHRPEVIVLDEPTTGLDPLLQGEFMALVTEAAGEGAAVLMSSHVLPEVDRIADRVAILRDGEIVHEATVAELHRHSLQRLELVLDSAPQADLSVVAGVESAVWDGTRLTVVMRGSTAALFEALAGSGITRVTSHDDDLEDTFAGYYRPDPTTGMEVSA